MGFRLYSFFSFNGKRKKLKNITVREENSYAVHVFIASNAADKLYPFESSIFGDHLWICKRSTKMCLFLVSLVH